jgi:hypothetical protein
MQKRLYQFVESDELLLVDEFEVLIFLQSRQSHRRLLSVSLCLADQS